MVNIADTEPAAAIEPVDTWRPKLPRLSDRKLLIVVNKLVPVVTWSFKSLREGVDAFVCVTGSLVPPASFNEF